MCLYVDNDGETLWLADGWRKARKEHKCRECKRTVQPGERYRYWKGLVEREYFETFKMCEHCWTAMVEMSKLTGCHLSWYWDQVFDMRPGAGEEGSYVRDALDDDEHQTRFREQPLAKLRIWHWGRRANRQWTRPDGSLYELPSAA